MEIITLLIFAIVIGLLFFTAMSIAIINKFKRLPGPRPLLPFFGNIHIFYRPEIPLSQVTQVVLDEQCKKFKKDGIFAIFFGQKIVVYLFKAKYVADFLNENTLTDKPIEYDELKVFLGNGLATANGRKWKDKRRHLNPTFHSKILENYIPIINTECFKLIYKLRETANHYVDVRSLISITTLNIISMTAMRISLEAESDIVDDYRETLHRIPSAIMARFYNPLNWFDFIFYRRNIGKQFLKDIKTNQTFIQNVINQRKIDYKAEHGLCKSKQMVFLDLLLTLQSEDDSITDNEIKDDVTTFMFAGHDTSFICLTWTLLLLANNQECQFKVIQEMNSIFGDDRERDVNKDDINHMHYTECVIKESLRLYPPVPFIGREAKSDVIYDGHKIPKGSSVFIPSLYVHKDEEVFPNSNQFIPERFENKSKPQIGYLPFALGPRNCIGQRFGMMEMMIILAHIFRNFSIKSLNRESDVKVSVDLTLKALSPINISFEIL